MRRVRRTDGPVLRAEASRARELVNLASRMGIPPEDAVRQVAQLLSEARRPEPVRAFGASVGPTT